MYACVVLLATALATADASAPPDGAAAPEKEELDDLSDLQGAWAVLSLEVNGQEVSKNVYARTQWIIRGFRVRYTSGGRVTLTGDLEARPRADPPTFDSTVAGQEHKDLAIYRRRGEYLEVAFTLDGSPRPTEFASAPGSGVRLIMFIRDRK
jgi:uncharacterized protein (TIGR03067 family)